MIAYEVPTTPAEWWALVDEHWTALCEIAQRWPMYRVPEEFSVERASAARTGRDVYTVLRCFNAWWWNAPDHPAIHAIPAWSLLCDLCSEADAIFYERR